MAMEASSLLLRLNIITITLQVFHDDFQLLIDICHLLFEHMLVLVHLLLEFADSGGFFLRFSFFRLIFRGKIHFFWAHNLLRIGGTRLCDATVA